MIWHYRASGYPDCHKTCARNFWVVQWNLFVDAMPYTPFFTSFKLSIN